MSARGTDLARTAATIGVVAPRVILDLLLDPVRPVPSTTTADGLARARVFGRQVLDRLRVTVDVVGQERVPREGGVLFMWNQTSHLAHLLLALAVPRAFASLSNNGVARTPLYGRWFRRNRHFHVDRTDETQWRQSVARAAAALKTGTCIVVSPEGTRSDDGELLPMKRGAFMLARAAERPIVCVTFKGAHECLPRGAFAVRPGHVRATLSEPIEVRADDERLEAKVVATFERDR
ncbi:MAG: lysophospholipid acyltransferase family protein, partial [Polyangiales bacterium]